MPTLRELMDTALDCSRKSVADTEDMMCPMWTLLSENGEVAIVGTPFMDDGPSKDAVVAFMKKFIRDNNVIAYVFANEAWMIKRETEREVRDSLPPSQCDDREEILHLVGVSVTEGMIHCRCPILPGRQTGEAEWHIGKDGEQLSGRFVIPLEPEGFHGRA